MTPVPPRHRAPAAGPSLESRMKRIPRDLLLRMAGSVSPDDRDEMAIPSYLHRNPAMRWMAWRRLEVVARFLRRFRDTAPADADRSILDFGCGTGVMFDEACRWADRVYGVDIVLDPARLLVEAWGLDRVVLMSPEEARQALKSGSIDVIIAAEVLEHIDPVDEIPRFFMDRLNAGGRLIVSLPTENRLYRLGRRLAGFEGHYHQDDAASIHRDIVDAGFVPVRREEIPGPGPMAIYWVIEYRLP